LLVLWGGAIAYTVRYRRDWNLTKQTLPWLALGAYAVLNALLAAARVCGGSAHVERRPSAMRDSVAAWGDGDVPGVFLMKRLKDAFDPNGVLEPGRGVVR